KKKNCLKFVMNSQQSTREKEKEKTLPSELLVGNITSSGFLVFFCLLEVFVILKKSIYIYNVYLYVNNSLANHFGGSKEEGKKKRLLLLCRVFRVVNLCFFILSFTSSLGIERNDFEVLCGVGHFSGWLVIHEVEI